MFWFTQLVLALKDIHRYKIMHRDIKTLNVFLALNNRPLVGDFGVSKVEDPDATAKGGMIGTTLYMAPEVCRSLPY